MGQTNCLPFAAGTHCGRSKNSAGFGVLRHSGGAPGAGNSKRMPPAGNRYPHAVGPRSHSIAPLLARSTAVSWSTRIWPLATLTRTFLGFAGVARPDSHGQVDGVEHDASAITDAHRSTVDVLT